MSRLSDKLARFKYSEAELSAMFHLVGGVDVCLEMHGKLTKADWEDIINAAVEYGQKCAESIEETIAR